MKMMMLNRDSCSLLQPDPKMHLSTIDKKNRKTNLKNLQISIITLYTEIQLATSFTQ